MVDWTPNRAATQRRGDVDPTLTQLAKTKRALFVEGKDFQILAGMAKRLGLTNVANRADFAVIPVEGYNPQRVKEFSKGMELTLGTPLLKGVLFDRDYRSDKHVAEVLSDLRVFTQLAHIHKRKELENYLLECKPLTKAIQTRLADQNLRTGGSAVFSEDIQGLLTDLSDKLRLEVQSQYLHNRVDFGKRTSPSEDVTSLSAKILGDFETDWKSFDRRVDIVPGKELLALLNQYLQDKYKIALSSQAIVAAFGPADIPKEIAAVLKEIEAFRKKAAS